MRSKNIPIMSAWIALVTGIAIPMILQSSSAQKRSDDDRVRAFRRRLQTTPESQITTTQAQQILQTKHYYASLSVRQPWVDEKGFLNFITPLNSGRGEVSGQNGTARFTFTSQVVEIGLRASAPAKNYLLDCTVQAEACPSCVFSVEGPDGHQEYWKRTDSDWKHLIFTISPGDTDWFVAKLKASFGMTFKSCDVMEVR